MSFNNVGQLVPPMRPFQNPDNQTSVFDAQVWWCYEHFASTIIWGEQWEIDERTKRAIAVRMIQDPWTNREREARVGMTAVIAHHPLFKQWALGNNNTVLGNILITFGKYAPQQSISHARDFLTLFHKRMGLKGCCLLGDETMGKIRARLITKYGHDA